MMAPALPPRLVPVRTDRASINALRQELIRNEARFSDESQRIGLGHAFALFGSSDAVSIGGPTEL